MRHLVDACAIGIDREDRPPLMRGREVPPERDAAVPARNRCPSGRKGRPRDRCREHDRYDDRYWKYASRRMHAVPMGDPLDTPIGVMRRGSRMHRQNAPWTDIRRIRCLCGQDADVWAFEKPVAVYRSSGHMQPAFHHARRRVGDS